MPPLAPGLFQSAYSARNHALWVTASAGRPPVITDSRLLRVDPKTLLIEAAYPLPVTDTATGAVRAVFGVAVDDEQDTVWTTNTLDDSVSVYRQQTGEHLATLPGVEHSREIVVDAERGTAWASAFGSGTLVAFDARTFEEKQRVTVEGAGPTGLDVNERTGKLYAADFKGSRIIEVTPGSATARLLPAGDGPLSVAVSADGHTAFTADQTGGTLTVVDLRTGEITKSVPTGEGAKSAAVDRRTGQVLVVNRLAGTVTAVDPHEGTVVRTVPTGALPNHVEIADGTAYVVDKSGAGPAGEDLITLIDLDD
ncbi:YncE family protein [Streptomyces sp. A7024]|uniref:YncE family protein n=1 Tax=Streptomyces coryli TaxID=1128680 RepID=A0A6G4TTH9_9ACTN|nr:YncE family protein [Streptomyces coryli]NGN63113.1 YncE family protein [Streptomyces coryli]